jgi:hypothetical protein
MALDQKLRRQLLDARENICAQLEQLEGGAVDPYDGGIAQGSMPDCRDVYADLQRELHEIDTLLQGDGKDGRWKLSLPTSPWSNGTPTEPSATR